MAYEIMAKKILIIEDQPQIVKMVQTRLKKAGYSIVTAKDGQEGIDKVPKENPNLIITDLAMPRMTGNVVIRILKTSEQFKHIPIIMLSAFITNDKMAEGVEIPADVYMRKPFDSEELLGKVKELLKD